MPASQRALPIPVSLPRPLIRVDPSRGARPRVQLLDSWHVAGGSLAGSEHAGYAVPCQDAFANNLAQLRKPLDRGRGVSHPDVPLVLCVCDGAGSATHSAAGAATTATLAVHIATEQTRELDWANLEGEQFSSAIERVHREILQLVTSVFDGAVPTQLPPLSVRDFQSTLVLAILKPPWLGVLQVGDGFVVIETEGKSSSLLEPPPQPSGDANVVTFLTSPSAVPKITIRCLPELTGVALSSDGLDTVAIDPTTASPVEGLFGPLFEGVRSGSWDSLRVVGLLRDPRVLEGTFDDVTLLTAAGPVAEQ